ncbi:MAG: FxsA family protein [Pseudomonadota bacterium]
MLLFLLLVLVPIIEIALFIEVGGWLGLWPTLAIVIATAFAGTLLLRTQGFRTLRDLQSRIDRREDPSGPLAHGALILVAGVVLLTPGFFTDALGLVLLVPGFRTLAIRVLARRVAVVSMRAMHARRAPGSTEARGSAGARGPTSAWGGATQRGQTVEGAFREVDDPDDPDPAERPPR